MMRIPQFRQRDAVGALGGAVGEGHGVAPHIGEMSAVHMAVVEGGGTVAGLVVVEDAVFYHEDGEPRFSALGVEDVLFLHPHGDVHLPCVGIVAEGRRHTDESRESEGRLELRPHIVGIGHLCDGHHPHAAAAVGAAIVGEGPAVVHGSGCEGAVYAVEPGVGHIVINGEPVGVETHMMHHAHRLLFESLLHERGEGLDGAGAVGALLGGELLDEQFVLIGSLVGGEERGGRIVAGALIAFERGLHGDGMVQSEGHQVGVHLAGERFLLAVAQRGVAGEAGHLMALYAHRVAGAAHRLHGLVAHGEVDLEGIAVAHLRAGDGGRHDGQVFLRQALVFNHHFHAHRPEVVG